jgi:hypothetical protein
VCVLTREVCLCAPLVQAVASAQKALGTALTGVVLSPEEQEQLSSRLQKAAAKKVADLLQVGDIPAPSCKVVLTPARQNPCSHWRCMFKLEMQTGQC